MRNLLMALAAGLLLSACEKTIEVPDGDASGVVEGPVKKFTFTIKGDFSDDWKPVTRGYLSADGKDMTDVWVLDYMDGTLVQQVHQSDNTDESFGMPQMYLTYGEHHVYFVASRGAEPALDTEAHIITFGNVRDTYWKRYDVNVVATSNGNRAVTLDRVVTKLRLTFTDAIPADAATIAVVPKKWYYGIDYMTGLPAGERTDAATNIAIPEQNKGQTGVQASIFGFSAAEEWTTDVVISSRTATDAVLGSATIAAAPFKANRVSDYQGPLFTSGGNIALSLNGDWDDSYEGTW